MAAPIVSIVDYAEFRELEEQLEQRYAEWSREDHEVWERFDTAIRDVMGRHGKTVGWDDGVDFYHGGDWFNDLYDGFALMTTTALSIPLLQDLQLVVSQHHPDASLSFGGEVTTPMLGLDVLVTSTSISAAWDECSAKTCRRKLLQTGVQIL